MKVSLARRLRGALVLAATLGIAASCGGGGGGGGGGGTHVVGLVDGASISPSAVVAAQTSFPGEFAADFLRRTIFTKLLVEIDYAEGHAPAASVVKLLKDRIAARCDKPGGVTILVDDPIPASEFGSLPLDVIDIEALEAAHRGRYADPNTQTAVLYVLLAKGTSDIGAPGGSSKVLAITYHGSSVALFLDVADQGNDPLETTDEVIGSALVHEAGHTFGLVNGGCPMFTPHEDPLHSGHDESSASVMFWLVQIDPVSPNLGDPNFALFGENCEIDIAKAGGLPASAAPARVFSASRSSTISTFGRCGTCDRAPVAPRAASAAGGG